MVLIEDCTQNSATDKGAIKPPVLCGSSETKAIPVDEYAQNANLTVRVIYVVLVGMAFVLIFALYPGRQFVRYAKAVFFGMLLSYSKGTR